MADRTSNPARAGSGGAPARRRCLTELSAAALIGGALGLSALLWLAIRAVL